LVLHELQPVVLVGGASSRFGRDKLREPIGRQGGQDQVLVDRSIRVLREVFGTCVATVGACAAEVESRGDLVLRDEYAGIGPMGGVISALERSGMSILVLPGDLTTITSAVIKRLIDVAAQDKYAVAVLAHTVEIQWCIGVYRQEALPLLKARLSSGDFALKRAIPLDRLVRVAVDERLLRNANHPGDLLPEVDARGSS